MLKPYFLKLYIWAMAICCATILLTSCEDDKETIPVSDVSFDDPALLLIEGQKQILKAIITPVNATNKNVTWQSEDDAVATVNASGEIEAKSVGKTIITVTTDDGNKTAICEITVQKPIASVSGISMNKTNLPLLVGEKETLVAIITPEDATFKNVTWESSNDAVATVNESGEVEAISIGTAIITVTTVDGGKTATCDVTVDASQFTVKFESNGGSEIEDVVVRKGELLAAPTNPVMEGGLSEGLYLGVVDPNVGSFTFEGWYTEETLENKYDFNTPITNDLTLYAKWIGDTPEPVDVEAATGNNILEKSYNYLNTLSLATSTEYTLVLANNISNPALQGNFKNANVSLLLIGKGEERVISKSNQGNLFVFEAGTFIIGDKIKITGTGFGNFYPLSLQGTANAILKEGAKLSDIKGTTANAGAVLVNSSDATFTMEGGEICNNVVERAAANIASGAVCISWGKFYMKGGIISGNIVKTNFNTHNIAGAVYINNWNQFHKTGGVISGNSAVITAVEDGKGKTGQQVFYSANNNNTSTWKKVDDDLGQNDNLSTDNVSNPLWESVQ